MRRIVFSIVLMFVFSISAFSQLNFSAAYTNVRTDFDFSPDFTGFPTAATFGLGYRLTPFQRRLEFLPQFSFLQSGTQNYLNSFDDSQMGQTIRMYGGKVDTRFYFFDFEGDCNCPTWNDKGQLFKKGFFMMLTGGVHRFDLTSDRTSPTFSTSFTASDWVFSFGGGAGLDIVFSEKFALTPFVSYERSNKFGWGNLHPCDFCNQLEDESAMGLLSCGLQLRYQWKK